MLKIDEDLTVKACSVAMKAHRSSDQLIQVENFSGSSSSEAVIFSFPGSGSEKDWFSDASFGAKSAKGSVFSEYLRSLGTDEAAFLNEAFLQKFEYIRKQLQDKVEEAVKGNKKIVFTGHSLGGPVAVLATIWFLQEYVKPQNAKPPFCVTFGSPLVGNHILSHALEREKWSGYFIHFVMRYDVVPRILLAPLSSIQQQFNQILNFFKLKSMSAGYESSEITNDASNFFTSVMRNASTIASHVACNLMGSTNLLLETITNFIQLSPYRPFGTYVFCTENGKLVTLKNSNAVLQLLFYSCQLSNETELQTVAYKSLRDHFAYESELKENLLGMQDVVSIDPLEKIGVADERINQALDDLGVSTAARLCLLASGESEKQKRKNQDKIDSKKPEIDKILKELESYRDASKDHKVGYYDAFKLQKSQNDFKANVKRLELAGIWDEIIEMLKRYELPDQFEGEKEWLEIGTRYRRIVEPLDIANYYRHLKNDDTGPYKIKGRPRRYRYTQRWREHEERMEAGSSEESCFLAEVEELRTRTVNGIIPSSDIMIRVQKLLGQVEEWSHHNVIGKDVFLEESTFVKWWKSLPPHLRSPYINAQVLSV
ncbi:hypothetical protein FEM48_Zijuj05G0158400 [Ziziphus jujuba var. spinosa]|uniref:Protein EDS1L-like n=1 Tax=Ziziphus jujuba var. spinosa TaxID=714518 RepID=A0A978VFQ4_ZIZJJ|nr:hypothetical protein FEM48_Zijuj05G0158400 [Ziziphus jujuba var. spinosa]